MSSAMGTRRSTMPACGSAPPRPAVPRAAFGWWLGLLASLACCTPGAVRATPSSTVWTPIGPDMQPFGVVHWGLDSYTTVFRSASRGAGSFPLDAGLTLGVLPFEKLQMEFGVDLVEPADHPVSFNAKLGFVEGSLFAGAPAVQLGLANAGTARGANDQNVVYLLVGRSIPRLGRLSFASYRGNSRLLVDPAGRREASGWMMAFDRGFRAVQGPDGEFLRIVLAADHATGRNALGGTGVALFYFFTRDISLGVGPVWFAEGAINGRMKWTVQIDINRRWFARD